MGLQTLRVRAYGLLDVQQCMRAPPLGTRTPAETAPQPRRPHLRLVPRGPGTSSVPPIARILNATIPDPQCTRTELGLRPLARTTRLDKPEVQSCPAASGACEVHARPRRRRGCSRRRRRTEPGDAAGRAGSGRARRLSAVHRSTLPAFNAPNIDVAAPDSLLHPCTRRAEPCCWWTYAASLVVPSYPAVACGAAARVRERTS